MENAALYNQLEPDGLVEQFMACPPEGFEAFRTIAGLPAFATRFDLLTTADAGLRNRVTGFPFYRYWNRLLRPRTCFIGSTVSEYALLPRDTAADALAPALVKSHASDYPLLIVKDIPQDSPLLDADANAYADAFVAACERGGWVVVEGQALAWVPVDFASVDAYLARLSPGRRKDIRRKLRARSELQIEAVPTGDALFDDPATLREFHALYLDVYAQSEIHFDKLGAGFFRALLQDAGSGGVVFVYRHAGRMIGYNICFVAHGNLLDKYVGFRYPQARQFNLYFVSWMHNLDYARMRGLRFYIAGWTDPQIKADLGARFTSTRHAVYLRNPILRALFRRLAGRFESDRQWRETGRAHSAARDRGAHAIDPRP
jgi:hypothetical protein